ncbi:hypothetical protein KY366_05385 [Candidatus Woesearchaeota archaeon]|nr:hypothetical protein [Candidatus Woesearchaeota archaeon]
MAATIISTVDLAINFKDFISTNSVDFDKPSFKVDILKAKDDDFLRVKKKIGSATTILAVDKVDDDFVNKAVLGE